MLEDNGYEIRILNTINFKKSMKYNPFSYIHSEKDILKFVQIIIANTKGEGEKKKQEKLKVLKRTGIPVSEYKNMEIKLT